MADVPKAADSTPLPAVRKGQGDVSISREEFARRVRERFYDPAFDAVRDEIEQVIEVAWDGYHEYRRNPRTRPAGPGFADPNFELPVEWLETRERIIEAERRQREPESPRRILLVAGAARHDQTCPGEMSKTFRLAAARARGLRGAARGSSATSSISACSRRSTDGRSSPARPACRPRCRSATGRAPAIRTTPWGR